MSPQALQTTAATADTLGGRIATAREAAGMTVAQLARRLSVKTTTVGNWESDRSTPRSNVLITVSGLLNVSPTWLLNGSGEAPVEVDLAADVTALRHELLDMRGRTKRLLDQIDRALKAI